MAPPLKRDDTVILCEFEEATTEINKLMKEAKSAGLKILLNFSDNGYLIIERVHRDYMIRYHEPT